MDTELTPFEALQKALEIAGSQSELARICGVSQPAVWKWLQSSKRISHTCVLLAEAATGVSRHDLRPDIYPFDNPRPRQAKRSGGRTRSIPAALDKRLKIPTIRQSKQRFGQN